MRKAISSVCLSLLLGLFVGCGADAQPAGDVAAGTATTASALTEPTLTVVPEGRAHEVARDQSSPGEEEDVSGYLNSRTLPGSDDGAKCWVKLIRCADPYCTCTGCTKAKCQSACNSLYCDTCTTAC